MLVHTLRRARNDTEITGLAPSARLLRLASPSQGGEVYTNGREWESGRGYKESRYSLGGGTSGLGGTKAGRVLSVAAGSRIGRIEPRMAY
jgi:hypothetical protein